MFTKPTVLEFANRNLEKEFVAKEVLNLIYNHEVRPEDILIVFHKEMDFIDLSEIIKMKDYLLKIRGYIKPYGNNKNDKDNYIFKENHLTISTTKGAKGYDAYVVFLVGADLFETNDEGRASFYVGATRAKLALYVTGILSGENLLHEALKLIPLL
jgi:superfamily I DNA and RNA helicase